MVEHGKRRINKKENTALPRSKNIQATEKNKPGKKSWNRNANAGIRSVNKLTHMEEGNDENLTWKFINKASTETQNNPFNITPAAEWQKHYQQLLTEHRVEYLTSSPQSFMI